MRSLAILLGIVGLAVAGARKDALPLKDASGTFISATLKPGAGAFDLKVALDNEGEKTLELPAQLVIMYVEKNGEKLARHIRVPGARRVPEGKGKVLVAQGTLTKAEIQGTRIVFTLKVGEGDAAADQQFTMASRIELAYQEDAGRLLVQTLDASAKRDRPDKPEKGAKRQPDNKPPANF